MIIARFKLHPRSSDEFKERLLGCFHESEENSAEWVFGTLVVKSDRTPQNILDDLSIDGFDLVDFVRVEFSER